MNEIAIYIGVALLLFGIEILYFKIAEQFSIIDKPNQRSSHTIPTVSGGGIIFLFAVILWFILNEFQYPLFVLGLVLISIISFMDDIKERPPLVRFLIHLIAFALLLGQTNILHEPIWLVLIISVICLGTINAFNFMDGINGITGIYALVNLITLLFINKNQISFTNTNLIIFVLIGVVIFLFFNYRIKARCFAGDVGSIALGFIQLFFLLQLCITSHHYGWILLLLVFGVDSVITILYRLRRKENIFKSHRSHLFQYLSNELKISHRYVSAVYGVIQLLVNLLVYYYLLNSSIWFVVLIMLFSSICYLFIREIILKRIGIKGLLNN